MKLCSIVSTWACTIELLPYAIENHLSFCDGVIVVWSLTSNHGAVDQRLLEFVASHKYQNVLFYQLEPVKKLAPLVNETRKRNTGIEIAKREGYTHFFIADADEMYLPEQVEKDKKLFDEPQINGLVCRLRVFVGKPTLSCADDTLIPFIHKLKKETYCGRFPEYPFAYDQKGNAHIDPSRRLNESKGIIMSDTVCQHYSYVRRDIDLKIQNSTAIRLKKREALIKRDMKNATAGYVSQMYGQPLKETENYFDICI